MAAVLFFRSYPVKTIVSVGSVGRRAVVCSAGLAMLALVAGCGGGGGAEGGRPRASASGKVSFDGKPVPAGFVVFTHTESGSTSECPITEGEYESESGKGPIVGDNTVAVTALDKVDGNPLFGGSKPTSVKVEAGGYTGDFNIAAADVSPAAERQMEDEK